LQREEKQEDLDFYIHTMYFDKPFTEGAQNALFKGPVRTAL
jgi:hypothetical protein